MPFHVIITGATGFIGSAVLTELLSSGCEVTVLLRPGSDTARLTSRSGFSKLVYQQMQDEATVTELRKNKPDIFIHCGWRGVGGDSRNESYQITENLPTTLASVELAASTGCSQWIGLGSQAEYGNLNCALNEDAPLRPTTLYGKAKLAAGVAALALCEARGMAGVWLRVFSTYGPDDSPNWFIPYVIRDYLAGRSPKLTKCEQLWDYLFVNDAARAVVAVANGITSGYFNLGSGTAYPLRDYIEEIRTALESPLEPIYGALPYRQDQVMHLEADISRLIRITKWHPTTSIAEGIKATIDSEKKRMKSANECRNQFNSNHIK